MNKNISNQKTLCMFKKTNCIFVIKNCFLKGVPYIYYNVFLYINVINIILYKDKLKNEKSQ